MDLSWAEQAKQALRDREKQLDLRRLALGKIVTYLVDENFPIAHLNAITEIVIRFNYSAQAQEEIFAFADELCKKYE
jgi:hypothetical protein